MIQRITFLQWASKWEVRTNGNRRGPPVSSLPFLMDHLVCFGKDTQSLSAVNTCVNTCFCHCNTSAAYIHIYVELFIKYRTNFFPLEHVIRQPAYLNLLLLILVPTRFHIYGIIRFFLKKLIIYMESSSCLFYLSLLT